MNGGRERIAGGVRSLAGLVGIVLGLAGPPAPAQAAADDGEAATAAEGRIPNRSYPSSELFTKISPQLGRRHHNQPTVINGYLLLAGNGVHEFWDIADPYAPVMLSTFSSPHRFGEAESHQVSYARFPDGRLLLATISGRGIDLWDIDDVRAPQLLSALELPGIDYGNLHNAVWGVAWQGDYIYVGASTNGLYIVDAADPAAPRLISTTPRSGLGDVAAGPLFALGNLLVVTTPLHLNGVATLDISDPGNPVLLDFVRPGGRSYIGWFHGRHAYLQMPLRVYDVTTDPRDIRLVSSFTTPHSEYVSFADGHLFLGGRRRGSEGIWKYDIRDPNDLRLVGRIKGRDPRWDDQFSVPIGNLVAVSDDQNVDGYVGSYLAVHATEPDTRAPVVEYVNPPDGAVDQSRRSRVGLSFSDEIDFASVDGSSLVVRPVGGEALTGKWGYAQTVVTFWPDDRLDADTDYEIVARAGGIADLVGNALADEFRAGFRTGAAASREPGGIAALMPVEVGDEAAFAAQPNRDSHAYRWDFGDGHRSGGASAAHGYASPGRYTVTLTVDGPAGQDIFEAESASLSGGVVAASDHAGYSGSGFADYPDRTGSAVKVRWGVARDDAGAANLEVRYANGSDAARQLELVVNGDAVETVVFPPTGGWASWRTAMVDDVGLEAGDNTIELVARLVAGPNIDGLGVSSEDLAVLATYSATQIVHRALTAAAPARSSSVIVTADGARAWAVNADADTVSAVDTGTWRKAFESGVGRTPRTLAQAPDGRIWVVNETSHDISVLDPGDGAVVATIDLPYASMPYGIAFAPDGSAAYVTLQALGRVLRVDPTARTVAGSLELGPDAAGIVPKPRGIALDAASSRILVSRFVSPDRRGEIYDVRVRDGTMSLARTITLAMDPGPDSPDAGRGVPNYISALAISPDGTDARVPSKKDNIERGAARDGLALTHENTVRTVVSRIDLASGNGDLAARIDLDEQDMAFAVAFSPLGDLLFIAVQGSNAVNVVDAYGGAQVAGIPAGLAPQGLTLDGAGRLYVQNFMGRSLSVFDVAGLLAGTGGSGTLLAEIALVADEKLSDEILLGKRIFYDASSSKVSQEGYISCASCHLDGGEDGRTWDFTDRGEGLRNTISLHGRGGTALQGPVHWTGNFDEIQDFEGVMRSHFGGSGFMTDADFESGTRSDPLGDPKAGLSAELDALAAYVSSLTSVPPSPYRNADGTLTDEGARGRRVFRDKGCGSCHHGVEFTDSARSVLHDIGTISTNSGQRLGQQLTGFDTPTLKGVWATAPYLHDGSASTLAEAVDAHGEVSLTDGERSALVSYLQQIDGLEVGPAAPVAVELSATTVAVTEGAPAAFEVTLSAAQSGPLSVAVTLTVTGAALSEPVPASVTIAAGETTATLTVGTVDDAVASGDGTVTAALVAGDGYVLGGSAEATVTVLDNDAAEFAVSAAPAEVEEGGAATVTVSIGNGVTYAEAREVALAVTGDVDASDYALPETVELAAGAATATATFEALADDVVEEPETATVTASLDGAELGSSTLTVTDAPPLPGVGVEGVPQVGATLTVVLAEAEVGSDANGAGVSKTGAGAVSSEVDYQWLRDGEEIAGATGREHVLVAADAGARLSVRAWRGARTGTSGATVPVWGPPGNPPVASDEQELLGTTMTLGTDNTRAWLAGYADQPWPWSFGSLDASEFELEGVRYELRAFAMNDGGRFAFGTEQALPSAAGLSVYWDGYRLSGFTSQTDEEDRTTWGTRTPQPSPEYRHYYYVPGDWRFSGPSDGVRVAVSVRRAVELPWGARLPERDIELSDASAPTGLWSDGETLWVVPDRNGSALHGYDLSTGERRLAKDLTLSTDKNWSDLWSDGQTLWASSFWGEVVAYRLSDGARQGGRSLGFAALASGGGAGPSGLWSDGETLWVVDHEDRLGYAFGLSDRVRSAARDIDLGALKADEATIWPWGAWSDGEILLTSDRSTSSSVGEASGWVRAYRVWNPDGTWLEGDDGVRRVDRLPERDIHTGEAGNTDPLSLWSDGETLWVVDGTQGRIYAYAASADPATGDPATGGGETDDGETGAGDGLTATLTDVPAGHNGTAFTVGLEFSEDVADMGYRWVRDTLVTATGGTLARVSRRAAPSNLAWDIEVEPASPGGDVVLSVQEGERVGSRPVVAGAPATVPGQSLSVSDATATEGGTASFAVTLDRGATGTVTVDYATQAGTADSGDDYTPANGTLEFGEGETSKTVAVALVDDDVDEVRETFTLTLSNASGAGVARATATGGILDNDEVSPTLSVSDATATEGGTASFPVTLDRGATGTVTVNYATADGTALQGDDYTSASGTLTFAASETSKTVGVSLVDDDVAEFDETFSLTLSNASGAGLAAATGTGTIEDDDAPTARLHSTPAEHGGTGQAFESGLSFSEEIADIGYAWVRDTFVTATNGTVQKAERVVRSPPENREWRLTVEPASSSDVVLSLTAGLQAPDGRPLRVGDPATVRGPAPTGVQVDGAALTLVWPSARDGFGEPSGSDYAVAVNGTPRAVASAEIAGRRAVLVLSVPVSAADAVTVGYVSSAMHPLADASGHIRSAPWDGVSAENVTGAAETAEPVEPSRAPGLADALAAAPAEAVRLDASGLGLADLAALGRLTALERLDLSDNALTNLRGIEAHAGLRELDLSGNRIADVGPLGAIRALERLDLSGNGVTDIAPLAGLTALRVLVLDDSAVSDLGPLTHLASLEHLGLADNAVPDVTPLQDLERLRRLDLGGNPVADLSPLGDVGSLEWLALPGEPTAAADALARLTGLRWVWRGEAPAQRR